MKASAHSSHPATEEPDLEPEPEPEPIFKDDVEICQQLMSRYSTSTAPQHRHLLATAAAIRSILSAESVPLTPASYFAAAMHNLSDFKTLDSAAVSALVSFLTIVTLLVPEKGIDGDKATESVGVLVRVLEGSDGLGVATVRGIVKCLGVLVSGFCNLEDWGSVVEGFETLLNFSVDKRPKVRRSAQECLEKVFKSFESSAVIKEASRLVLSLLRNHMPVAVALIADGYKDESLSKRDYVAVLHMLNLLKVIVPYLSDKISSKILDEMLKLLNPQFLVLTRHLFKTVEAFLQTSSNEVIGPHTENFISHLALYVSLGEKNPVDTLISASILLKTALDKLYGSHLWMKNFPKVCSSIAGLLNYDAVTASQASTIAKELINGYVDPKVLLSHKNQVLEDANEDSEEAEVIKSTCAALENTLNKCDGFPNEHLLGVVSFLLQKLGEVSYFFMKNILLKVADLMNHAGQDTPGITHLQTCIGSAVVAMGPERILELIPISMDAGSFTCSNVWLVPILKNHVVGASLGYYMEHIVPLAKSLRRAGRQVKKSVIGQDLQAHAYGLLGLLPSFCRYPVDGHKKLGSLCELLIIFLKDSSMHQNVAVALQVIVNQNKSILVPKTSADESNSNAAGDYVSMYKGGYSKKVATKNIKALASCSAELLRALADFFIDSISKKCLYIKDAVSCLASITDSSTKKSIFMSLLERFQFVNSSGEFEVAGSHTEELVENEEGDLRVGEKDDQRNIMLELASSLMVGANEDLIILIYIFVVYSFQATDMAGHYEAYFTLSRILEEHCWFCSSRFVVLVDFLLGLKPPNDVQSLKCRFACFRALMAQALQMSLEEENTKAFLILNEIVLTLKDGTDDARKVAYDALLLISSSLRNAPNVTSSEPYHKLISMLLGYLSGSSPHITSGAVSALSGLVYNDSEICHKMPDLVSSLLSLLRSKAVEVIKAVLGFIKVLVSCLPANELQNFLSDIISGVLPWSSVSRNHFRSKVTVILEIVIRKCGSGAVESVTAKEYKVFLKKVLQNRHQKSTSKDSGITDDKTVLEDTSTRRPEKRKHKELGFPADQNDSKNPKRRKGEKQQRYSSSSAGEPQISIRRGGGFGKAKGARRPEHNKTTKSQPEDGRKRTYQKGPFRKGQAGGGDKRKMEQRNTKKKGEAASSASKSQKA